MPGLYLESDAREKGQTMPQDITLRSRHTPLAPIAAISLAAMAIVMIASANAPVPANDTGTPQIEDWHGNVMRSQWGNGANDR